MRLISVLLLIFILVLDSYSKSYYISNNGNDHSSGLCPSSSFRTINRLNQLLLSPGDSILFQRNHIFYGTLKIEGSGNENQPVYIGSFGSGNMPVISGAIPVDGFTIRDDRLYAAENIQFNIKEVYQNGKLLTLARYPNNKYLRIDSNDSVFLYDSDLSSLNITLKGARLRVLTCNWQWEHRLIELMDKDRLILDSLVWRPFRKGFGYYLENHPAFLDTSGEWLFDTSENTLLIYSDKDVREQDIRITSLDFGIRIGDGCTHLLVEGIKLEDFHHSGILIGKQCGSISLKNISVSNTEQYGILCKQGVKHITIAACKIFDVRGIAISMLEPDSCLVEGNEIKRIGLIPGYGFDGVNNGTAIAIINREFRESDDTRVATDNIVRKNRIDSTGYNGIRLDGRNNLAEYNVVENAVLTMNDGAGIYCWALPFSYYYTSENTIRYNIVKNVLGNTLASAGDHNMTSAYYIDNFSNKILLENNISLYCEKGILINDATTNITVKNNFFYDTREGLAIDIYKNDKNLKRGGHIITNNTFFLRYPGDVGIAINYKKDLKVDITQIDYNSYIKPMYPTINRIFTSRGGVENTQDYQIKAWQDQTGFDNHSTSTGLRPGEKWWEVKDRSFLFLNDGFEEKLIVLSDQHLVDENAQTVNELRLKPFEARVLLRQE